jgi:hypothetical protein
MSADVVVEVPTQSYRHIDGDVQRSNDGGQSWQAIAANPDIIAALAEEGLEIDQEKVAAAVAEEFVAKVVFPTEGTYNYPIDAAPADAASAPSEEPVTELSQLKDQINASFEEVASLLLDMNRRIEDIEARLEAYNKRGGHRI